DLTALNYFGYRVNTDAVIAEELSVDDNSLDVSLQRAGALVVNRFTPTRYPATLRSLRIRVPVLSDQPNPVGSQIKLVVLATPTARTSRRGVRSCCLIKPFRFLISRTVDSLNSRWLMDQRSPRAISMSVSNPPTAISLS